MDEASLFTTEDFEGDFYRFRNNSWEPKRIKFFVISTFRPATNMSERYDKRTVEVEEKEFFGPRDVETVFLRNNFINKFAQAVNNEKHLQIFQNIKEHELFEELEALKKDETLEFYDCYIFIILSFISSKCSDSGQLNIHLFESLVSVDKLWETVGEISWMRGKPKVFLIQADDVRLMMESKKITKSGSFMVTKRKIPTGADRLTIFSSIPAKYFVEGHETPSFLLQAFVEKVEENMKLNRPHDLLSLTTMINQRVAELIKKSQVRKTQELAKDLPMICTTSTFRKLLII